MKRVAVYPGSFDPITNGHLDLIIRASKLFDEVIILLAINPNKKYRFDLQDRVEMVTEAVSDINNVYVDTYDGLTVEYASSHGACALIRGIRVVSDFEYEWQLNIANEYIDPSIETVFLMSNHLNTFISSSTIHELAKSGVDISSLVPEAVVKKYEEKF